MNLKTYLSALKSRQVTLAIFIVVFLIIAATATFIQPLKYGANSRLLIIQDNANADPYSISKSNQYLGNLLTEFTSSGSFFESLSGGNSNIDWSYFNGTYKEQIKRWKQTISTRSLNDTGIIEINIYHPNPEQARQISVAVDNLLTTQSGLYQNLNSKMKIIDQPTISSWPVKPNVPVNIIAGLIFGILFGLIYIYYFPISKKKKQKAVLREIMKEPKVKYETPLDENVTRQFNGDIRNII